MLLHRYEIKVTPGGVKLSDIPSESAQKDSIVKLTIITSFYRRTIDASYKQLVTRLTNEGIFDEYIAALVMALINTGNGTDITSIDNIVVFSRGI